ncbi:hypothetical protein EDC04DRAFT_2686115 [Pisolithus marmoratus]|nr:hypothetical protein EDC04DRAFT_2686115 [Pisolithus marmoratus]
MYYRQQATSHIRTDDSDTGHMTPDRDSGQPNQQLPSIDSMSLPGTVREEHVHDYRTSPHAVPAPAYPSSPSHFLYPSHHQQNLQLHPSAWDRLSYSLGQSGDPSPLAHRFAPQHQHQHRPDLLHRTEDTFTGLATLVPEDDSFLNAARLDPSLMMTHSPNYITRPRPIADPPLVPSPSHPTQSSQSPPQTQESSPTAGEESSTKLKKSRRMKPRIELAPDQPLTTQGKPRARVFVACVQCRTRKIRCDGAKPACHNCVRRSKADDECTYDAAPKRRGPDRVPGARQRVSKEATTDGAAAVGTSSDNARRQQRRRGEEDANNGGSTVFSDDASGRDEGIGGVRTSSAPVLAHPPIHPPSLMLDPQLSGMTTFAGGVGSIVATSTSAAPQIPHGIPTSTPTAALNAGLGSVIPSSTDDFVEEMLYATNSQGLSNTQVYELPLLPLSPLPRSATKKGNLVHSFIRQQQPPEVVEGDREILEEVTVLSSEPSLEFTRKTWWESLLVMYSTDSSFFPNTLTAVQRQQATTWITADLRLLFRVSGHWFSFFNVPTFLSTFIDPQKRERMQPSLAYAALAVATLLQSSEIGRGSEGREMALRLRDMAQGALEASLCARWVDEELAQAAWLLAFFEICPHPSYAGERARSSLFILDTIIRALSLATLDEENLAAVRFNRNTVPVVGGPHQTSPSSSSSSRYSTDECVDAFGGTAQSYPVRDCACSSLSLGQSWPASREYTPFLVSTPGWDDAWTPGEIRKETCRRLCWNSIMLAAGSLSYLHSAGLDIPDYFIGEPANIALLFPGEAMISHYEAIWAKNTVWALLYRTALLWHSCLRMRRDQGASETDRARFGINAWLEADKLERALDSHTCGLERSYFYQGRELLFNVRYTISNEFQKYIPIATINTSVIFHRGKAEEWLRHQASVAQGVVERMSTLTGHAGHSIIHRPVFTFWFMSQIRRALSLWERDNSLTLAVDVCIAFLKPIDYLSAVWPCRVQAAKAVALRKWLARACEMTGRPPPPPNPPSI